MACWFAPTWQPVVSTFPTWPGSCSSTRPKTRAISYTASVARRGRARKVGGFPIQEGGPDSAGMCQPNIPALLGTGFSMGGPGVPGYFTGTVEGSGTVQPAPLGPPPPPPPTCGVFCEAFFLVVPFFICLRSVATEQTPVYSRKSCCFQDPGYFVQRAWQTVTARKKGRFPSVKERPLLLPSEGARFGI